jgi:glutamine synthetase
LSVDERKELGIDSLPGSLIEAIELTEKSDVVREALGEHVFRNFTLSKKVEWDDYRMKIHPYEIDKFLPIL